MVTDVALSSDQVAGWFDRLSRSFGTAVEEYGELDRLAGDGDFGLNMSVALTRIETGLGALDHPSVSDQLRVATRVYADNGGSSGPLLSAVFRELTRGANSSRGLDVGALADAVRLGTDRIQTLGGAHVGDSTMIDALEPAANSLRRSADGSVALSTALDAAALAATAGAASTGDMMARRGRASYVGEHSRTVQDPGARFVALLLQSLADAVAGRD